MQCTRERSPVNFDAPWEYSKIRISGPSYLIHIFINDIENVVMRAKRPENVPRGARKKYNEKISNLEELWVRAPLQLEIFSL